MNIIVTYDAQLFGFTFVLLIVAVTLMCFLAQQVWYVSVNRTQVELDKIDDLEDEWEAEGKVRTYVHAYDHGLLKNWKAFLFPQGKRRHPPKDYTAEWEEQLAKDREWEEAYKQKKIE
jgi:hypothetical protein